MKDNIETFYKKLINESIRHFDNDKKIVDILLDFFQEIDCIKLIDDDHICFYSDNYIYVRISELDNKNYKLLKHLIIEYFKLLNRLKIENINTHIHYIKNYLQIIYYRAFMYEENPNDNKDFIYGINPHYAYNQFYKDVIENVNKTSELRGILEYFNDLGFNNNLCLGELFYSSSYKLISELLDKILKFEDFDLKKYLEALNQKDFMKVYSSYCNYNANKDYRLYCHILIRILDKIQNYCLYKNNEDKFNEIKDSNSIEDKVFKIQYNLLQKALNYREKLETFENYDDSINFYEISEKLDLKFFADFENIYYSSLFLPKDKEFSTLLYDLSYFLPTEFKVYINVIDNVDSKNCYTFSTIIKIIQDEMNSREVSFKNNIIKEANTINEQDKESLVLEFLKFGNDGSCYYQHQNVIDDKKLISIYNKIKSNINVFNILAAYQFRYNQNINYGSDDYTFLICGPIKIIERIMKLEIKKHYNNYAYKMKKNDRNVFIEDYRLNFIPDKIYNIEIGGCVLTIQNAMKKINHQFPWFLATNNNKISCSCVFYNEFVSKVRNGYFHMDIIYSHEHGKDLYKKVAYWIDQLLYCFNPF